MSITHNLSATTPDNTDYEIRPSHWNEAHVQFITLTGNTAGASTISGTNIVFSGGPNATLSVNGNTLVWSGGAGAAGNTGSISAGTTRGTLGEVVFSNSNGLSFGIDGQTVTASHNGLTSQSNQAFSAAGGSSAFQTLSFNNANGVSFSNAAGAVEASIATSLTNIKVSAGTLSANRSDLTFSNSNGLSFGLETNGVITGSHNGLTSQSNQALSGQNGSFTFQTASFSNANGISFGTSAGPAITASHNAITSQSNQVLSMFAVGNTTQSSSGTENASSLEFRGEGIASVGISGGSVVVSVPSGGGGLTNINVSAGTTSQNLSNLVFSNSNGVSFGLNGSTITGSVAAGGEQTLTWYDNIEAQGANTNPSMGRSVFSNLANRIGIAPLHRPGQLFPGAIMANTFFLDMAFSGSTATMSRTFTASFMVGIYTRSSDSLSLLNSVAITTGYAVAATNNSTGFAGNRFWSAHSSNWSSQPVFREGSDYWIATIYVTTGVNVANASGTLNGNLFFTGLNRSGTIGQSQVATTSVGWAPFFGHYTVTSSVIPVSLAKSGMSVSGINGLFQPRVLMFGADASNITNF